MPRAVGEVSEAGRERASVVVWAVDLAAEAASPRGLDIVVVVGYGDGDGARKGRWSRGLGMGRGEGQLGGLGSNGGG